MLAIMSQSSSVAALASGLAVMIPAIPGIWLIEAWVNESGFERGAWSGPFARHRRRKTGLWTHVDDPAQHLGYGSSLSVPAEADAGVRHAASLQAGQKLAILF